MIFWFNLWTTNTQTHSVCMEEICKRKRFCAKHGLSSITTIPSVCACDPICTHVHDSVSVSGCVQNERKKSTANIHIHSCDTHEMSMNSDRNFYKDIYMRRYYILNVLQYTHTTVNIAAHATVSKIGITTPECMIISVSTLNISWLAQNVLFHCRSRSYINFLFFGWKEKTGEIYTVRILQHVSLGWFIVFNITSYNVCCCCWAIPKYLVACLSPAPFLYV